MATKKTKTPLSLALARTKVALAKAKRMPEVLPAMPPPAVMQLGDDPSFGQLGLQPVALTEQQEQILGEKVDSARVLIKPTGAVYYSHIDYTRWFNRAFGRTQWALVPVAKPKLSDIPQRKEKLATQVFLLYINGRAVAQATGEQEYHPENHDQSYADVVEALNASALRRVAKRLGVSLELWDRRWTNDWRAQHCVQVWVEGKDKPQWRLKDDKPFYKERPMGTPARGRATPGEHPGQVIPHGGPEINEGQLKRLWAIFRKSGRDEVELKAWLKQAFGIDSTRKIRKGDYEAVVAAIQKPGPLGEPEPAVEPQRVTDDDIPWGPAREPGQEG